MSDTRLATERVTQSIARTLRTLRQDRGWSIDALAARAGVSRGMVIQIEQARTNPSVGTLVRIADALGISLGRLVELTDQPSARVLRSKDALTLWTSASGGRAELVAGTQAPPAVELWRWRLGAGDHYRAEAHPPGTVEMILVGNGELSVVVDSDSYVLEAGDAIVFRADRNHSYATSTGGRTDFLMVVSTAGSDSTQRP